MTAACPRLRPIELFPTEIDGRRVVCLRDPAGLSEQLAFVPNAAVVILSLCDGRRTAADVAHAATRRLGATVDERQVRELLDQLDEALLLDTPRFHAHARRLLEEFRAAPLRAATHAGQSYPGDRTRLVRLLDRHLDEARRRAAGDGGPGRGDGKGPAGIVAPHIDFTRGAPVYGDAYAPLADAAPVLDLVVVFGTDHVGTRQPFTLTRKSYDTPLGATSTDVGLVDALARRLGEDALFEEEFHHRQEHSLEFQAVWLKHVLGDRLPPLLPVLCGPFGECAAGRVPDARDAVRAFVEALRDELGDRRVLVIAGADLAHVGPRFGDPPFDAARCAEVEAADRRALAAVDLVDPDGFWNAVAIENDRFRVCGLSPIYSTLAMLASPGGRTGRRGISGELLGYAQCPADDGDGDGPTSWVSIAASALG
jgi:hypothetical protein